MRAAGGQRAPRAVTHLLCRACPAPDMKYIIESETNSRTGLARDNRETSVNLVRSRHCNR